MEVLILGTYHFSNPGLDAVKVTQQDTLGPKRQSEIQVLVESLANFNPTKILVEVDTANQTVLDQQYQNYLEGRSELTSNEIQQVGFRIAKKLRLRKLHAVDYKSDMDFKAFLAVAEQYGLNKYCESMRRRIEVLGQVMSDWDSIYTVSDILAIHNSPAMIQKSQELYTDMLVVNKHPNYPGADLLASWYRRNLVIYQNIRKSLSPGDRALILYGSGHAYYLTQLFRDSGYVDLADPSRFLPRSPVNDFSHL